MDKKLSLQTEVLLPEGHNKKGDCCSNGSFRSDAEDSLENSENLSQGLGYPRTFGGGKTSEGDENVYDQNTATQNTSDNPNSGLLKNKKMTKDLML